MVSSGLHATEVPKKKKKGFITSKTGLPSLGVLFATKHIESVGHALQLEMLGMPLCHFNQGSMNTCHIHVYKSISRSWS